MPVAVSRKIEYFVRTFGLDLDVRVFPVVLTLDQVQYYHLPRTPIKDTERRRMALKIAMGKGRSSLTPWKRSTLASYTPYCALSSTSTMI